MRTYAPATMLGSMGAGHGHGGKIVLNVLAVLLMAALGRKIARR